MRRFLGPLLLVTIWAALMADCATVPDTRFLSEGYTRQAALFENTQGQLSAKQSAAIVAELKKKSGNIDILDRQLALEQQIVGNALVVGNKVTLLQDGPATYRAMFAAISNAKDHINVESFIIEGGEIGKRFATLLKERRAKGVTVNVIYDSMGAIATPGSFFDELKAAGIQVLEFNPVNPLAVKKAWSVNKRDHRKLLIVDGRIAFLGGINISRVYSSGSSVRAKPHSDLGWRDTDVEVDGPVVADFQRLFLDSWKRQHGPPLPERKYFPSLSPQGNDIVRAIGSTPDDPYSLIYVTLISAITNAEKRVWITNAYFVPDPQLMHALLDAAARGVDVRLLLPGQSDSPTAFLAGRAHYTRLLEGGVRIYERRGSMLHAKTATVDGVWSVVGSSNLDWRSAVDNDEINAVILGHDFAEQMEATFSKDLDASAEIELDHWKKRSFILRLKEWMAVRWGRLL